VYDPSDPTGGSLPPPPPPPPGAPPAGLGNPRYVYLITRLRSRQITMEEATELFSLQQQLIRDAQSRRPAPSAPSPDGSGAGSPGSPLALVHPMTDEGIAWSLLAIGAGAGVLAAIMKRAQDGPKAPGASAP
jgi:hypothetical protein